jgi:hypothetical protein
MVLPQLGHGLKEVYNTATLSPYKVIYKADEGPTLNLSGGSLYREENWTEAELNAWEAEHGDIAIPDVALSASVEKPIRILMRCVRGGKLLHSVEAQRPQFVRELDLPILNLILVRATQEGNTTLYVDRVPINADGTVQFEVSADPDKGDFVSVGERDYWEASNRKLVGYDIEAGTLVVTPAVNGTNDPDSPYPPTTQVRIVSRKNSPDVSRYTFASGVGVLIYPGVTLTLTATAGSVEDELPISEGDYILIDLPGPQLEKAEGSIQTVTDVASIKAGHGKRNARLPDNRFLDASHGLLLVRYTVRDYRWPHWLVSGGSWRMLPYLQPLDRLRLWDGGLFPNSPNRNERVYLRSVSFDLERMCVTVSARGMRDLTA